jgi:hypothetical protein
LLWEFNDQYPGINFCGDGTDDKCTSIPYADFDGDGALEFVALRNNPPIGVRIFDGLTGQLEASIPTGGGNYRWVRPVDINQDQIPEIAVFDEHGAVAFITFVGPTTAAPSELPITAAHANVRPNPFNPSATIDYSIPAKGDAALQVYDIAGRLVRTLVKGAAEPGTKSVVWDGRDSRGQILPSGTYFYSLILDGRTLDKGKAVILK